VQQTRTADEVKKFVSKLRVYTISDRMIRVGGYGITFRRFFSLKARAPKAGWNTTVPPGLVYPATGIIKTDRCTKFEMVDNPRLLENIINNHGPLGAIYPKLEYIMEGDTPSFIGLIKNGLGSALSPAYGGWAGRYDFFRSYAEKGKIWTNNMNSVDEVRLEEGKTYASDQSTIWRCRDAFQNDFAGRMDRCIAGTYSAANHNPVVA
jgi:hypothetical protein